MTKKPKARARRSDVFSPQKRSEIMRAVKSKNTKPEIALRKALHAKGFRYRLNARDLPGAPDIVLPRYRAVIFVHGCFWHGHDCARGNRQPKTNEAYWREKIARNKERDAKTIAALQQLGWRVKISWECDLKDAAGEANKMAGWLSRLKTGDKHESRRRPRRKKPNAAKQN